MRAFHVVPDRSIVGGEDVGLEPRNSPSCLNTACDGEGSTEATAESFQFMDGRVVGGLEEQSTLPITWVSREPRWMRSSPS